MDFSVLLHITQFMHSEVIFWSLLLSLFFRHIYFEPILEVKFIEKSKFLSRKNLNILKIWNNLSTLINPQTPGRCQQVQM